MPFYNVRMKKITRIAPILLAALALGSAAFGQDRNPKLEAVLHHGRAFAGSSASYSVQLIEKEGLIQVANYASRDARNRIKDAIFAARCLINYSPTQFTAVATRYLEPSSSAYYSEVLVTAKEITSLSVGTSTLEDLIKNAAVIDIGPQDNQTSILNKYLTVAEKQMSESNFWEAEQVVDAALRAVGTAPPDQSRLTQDMLNLADGLDARGDLERAERVLKRVLDVRAQNGNLDDADAERTINHLTDLYVSDKRYGDAVEMLNRLMSNPALSQSANPRAYANNLERLAVCHYKSKNYDQALTELTQVVALRRQNAGEYSTALALALEELGDTYQAQGQTATARDNYKAAHAIYDHAVVSRSRAEKMDYQNYYAHVKQLDVKMGKTQ
ncbi:MAG: tetratricopeptide repeat protein [Cyanobacteria bacterium SZAS TMP-1]|nr:tetratricopeptide repeat protein [Cyanobacteria bacterium SZAS TMP-1]